MFWRLLFVVCCCLLFVVSWCLFFVASLLVVGCRLLGVGCWLFVVFLRVVSASLFVGC